MSDNPSYQLLCQLITKASVTPDDLGCQRLISEQLTLAGFQVSHLPFAEVDNLWATHGQSAPFIVFSGHTDVVPAGDLNEWQSDPFVPTVREGKLYGRGTADMKSGVACMTTALTQLVAKYPNHPGTLAILLTSDEEGPAISGTRAVLAKLHQDGLKIDYAIIGEPTCQHFLGDTARNGRRGSLHLNLTIHGQGGHVAYPQSIHNPNNGLGAVIARLSAFSWDQGNADFPPTSFQISNLSSGDGTENVVPSTAFLKANWRFNPIHSVESLQILTTNIINETLAELGMHATCQWRVSAEPFITYNPLLIEALTKAIYINCHRQVQFNTAGGTSDARFFAHHGIDTIEFGPINATIHQANEYINLADLEPLTNIYIDTIINLWQETATND